MAATAAVLVLASPLLAPQLLAFPYKTETEAGTIWSEQPLDHAIIAEAVEFTRARMSTTPIATATERRPIFLTNGGWRWLYLANKSYDSFAITRPFTKAVMVNRVDPATGIVDNGRAIGGQRKLGGVLAHEFTHGLVRRHFGFLASRSFPNWKVEGYCDHVAGESTLTNEDIKLLETRGSDHPAIEYYVGRQRVAAILRENGGSVDRLFEAD